MTDILIHGPYELLSCYLAATYLVDEGTRVFIATHESRDDDEFQSGIAGALEQLTGADKEDAQHRIGSRLQMFSAGTAGFTARSPRFAQIWYFSSAAHFAWDSRVAALEDQRLPAFLRELGCVEFEQFNYVEPASFGFRNQTADTRELHAPYSKSCVGYVEECLARRKKCRIFRPALIFGKISPLPKSGARDLLHFIKTISSFKAEIEERSPEYFEYQSLRCCLPEDCCLGVTSAAKAAEWMTRMTAQPGAQLERFDIPAGQQLTFGDLCEWVGATYGLSLLPTGPDEQLNALDRVFNDRLADFYCAASIDHIAIADATSAAQSFDEARAKELFTALRCIQEQERTERSERVAWVQDQLKQVSFSSNGFELNYLAGGKGTPLVLLNALGQGLHSWSRIIERLIEEHRIIVWEPRGVTCEPYACGLHAQVHDLKAILQHERVEACHLMAWCTGPKVAVEFCVRYPESVTSMLFLNSTFKCFDRADLAETAYEHNLESLCRVVDKRPAMALSVMNSLRFKGAPKEIALDEAGSETLAASVLSLINRDLSSHVLAPFRNETTTLNYVRQLMDFWSHDSLAKAGLVNVPVLLISSEYDEIASPEASEEAARILPRSWHMQVRGATHYCLYDRPDFIANLARSFCSNAQSFSAPKIPASIS